MTNLVDCPEWMTNKGFKTLSRGYLLKDETVKEMYQRVAGTAAKYMGDDAKHWEAKFFDMIWKGWLCPASPILTNMGTKRGLPISCYGIDTPDTMEGIGNTNTELMMLTKYGGGVGINLYNVRGRGASIKNNGHSEGVVPWCKIYDSTILASNQGSTRKGAASVNLPVWHVDLEEFLRIRRPQGDVNRQCLNLNHCVGVDDKFMNLVESGNEEARETWREILKTRFETGEPYIIFYDNINKNNPLAYKNNNLDVTMTNICTEIVQYTDEDHSFVCDLASLNLYKWDEWKDTDLPYVASIFLDCVMEEFITRAKTFYGFERAVRGAEKGRSIGIGALGWHSLLQSKMMPMDTSMEVMRLQADIWSRIKSEAERGSRYMAERLGEPEWCKGTGMRNAHLMAGAPTVSNSIIAGSHSPWCEPWTANTFMAGTAKGMFEYKNKELERILEDKQKNTSAIWKSIVKNVGSVQHLDFLSDKEKEVFLTAREINQMVLITHAAQRYQWIDQAQSLNLFFPANVDPAWFHKIHMEAWRLGIKSLYYCRSSSILKGDVASRFYDDGCLSCEG